MDAPIFIIGRQHSGNTMLASMLGRHPDLLSLQSEGTFFEHRSHLERRAPDRRIERIVESIEGGFETANVPDESSLEALRAFLHQSGASTPTALYRKGMDWLTEQHEAERWVQKATSYVFYLDSILKAFPDVRLIFLMRNPLDLAASLKRRGEWRRALRMVWGWNRGTKAALRWTASHPDQMLVVRYEDLVQAPREMMEETCTFADLSFSEVLLEIPHVNRSETPYNQESDQAGLNASRVHYYPNVLSPEEEAVVRSQSDSDIMSRCYSDLPTARDCEENAWMLTMGRAFIGSVSTIIDDHAGALVSEPHRVLDRIGRRLG